MSILSQIIEILVSGLTSFGSGLGAGIQSIVQALFVATDATTGTQSLTTFGILVACFGGLALCTGLTRRLFNWLITLGGSK